ncbi:MAG TPA: segregation/condensation protein A [Actinobacteria bacterium]|nr:segregation/condensation protein A [Actinomycetota bacterium]
MTYHVHTRVFDGPLDLLLQLITARQLEITEVSLGELVTEYLAHLELMERLDMEVTSEFLLIAATLIQLKARRLLPDDRDVDLDEELALAEERDRLLARLLACLTFKDVAAVLAHRLARNAEYVPRLAGLDPEIVPTPPEVVLPVDLEGFAALAGSVFARPPEEPDVDHLDLDLPSVTDAMVAIQARMDEVVETDFEALVEHCDRPAEVVAFFLAVLELTRWGVVSLGQEHREAPIRVRRGEAFGREIEAVLAAATREEEG